jgi:cell division protein FtsB
MPDTPATSTKPATTWWVTTRGIVVSLLFWSSLLTAAALYGGVVLAPKGVTWRTLQRQFHEQQTRLLELERHTEQLQLVVEALERDPQFVAELARLELDAARPGEELIAVDAGLSLNPWLQRLPDRKLTAPAPDPWLPHLQRLASDDRLRRGCLLGGALLVLFAFTFLHDPTESPHDPAPPAASLWSRVTRRYRAM